MKRVSFVTLLAVFVFATSALVASAATHDGLWRSGTTAADHFNAASSLDVQSGIRTTAVYVIASFQDGRERQDYKEKEHDRGRGRDKERFHGAEMGPTAIVLAGVFAISAYFLFVRRKAHKNA
jgi:hypothetical protein